MQSAALLLDDTIAAIATAPGEAGLAVLRVSGPDALPVAQVCFESRHPLSAAASHTLHHGWAVWPAGRSRSQESSSRRLDEVVVGVFRAPRSYTREDVVEFSCHGGELPVRRVLAAVLAAGARLARPGEFTLRAFLGGRLDLTQAEAVADLIHAETEAAGDLAMAQLSGALSSRLKSIADRVLDCVAEVEARVDFAEDVGGIEVPASVQAAVTAAREQLGALLAGNEYARAVRDGLRVTLAGRPNAGKSSLFNALLGEARAIVSEIPGTTRDRVSERLELDGIRVMLSDTAGVRATSDPVERIGVERTGEALDSAAVVLWVVDGSEPLAQEDLAFLARGSERQAIWALNKSDLGNVARMELAGHSAAAAAAAIDVSAQTGVGVPALRSAIVQHLGGGAGSSGAGVSNARHVEALSRAERLLAQASAAAASGSPGEIVALELRESLAALGEVTGTHVGEDLLDRIFSRFCIGK